MHPGVFPAKLTPSDQHEIAGRLEVDVHEELRARLADQVTGRRVGLAIGRRDPIREPPGLERPEIHAVGRPAQLRKRQPVGSEA